MVVAVRQGQGHPAGQVGIRVSPTTQPHVLVCSNEYGTVLHVRMARGRGEANPRLAVAGDDPSMSAQGESRRAHTRCGEAVNEMR